MSKNVKLELTWIGKNNDLSVEPRILVENTELSNIKNDENTENMLIHGDNLLALKALEQNYSGKIKCIYIDPPYNTGSAFEHYDDNLEHSTWLSLMKPRLELLKNLLSEDGLIFVQIDDNEQAYLTVLMDEIFGRNNRLNTICIKMSEASGVKMAHVDKRLPKLKEYILVYYKEKVPTITPEKVQVEKWNNEYKNIITGLNEDEIDELHILINLDVANEIQIERCNQILKKAKVLSLTEYFKLNKIEEKESEQWKFQHAKYIIQAVGSSSVFNIAKKTQLLSQDLMAVRSSTGLIYLIKTNFDINSKQPRVQIVFADENLLQNQGDLWLDIKTTGGVGQEGNVLFANSKKPEKLLKKIISMCTRPGDYVLDSFLGSGTTCAVAHKMNRKWIGVEMGDHAYTHAKKRLDSVIYGTDQTGISKVLNWSGGGGYKFYELAPTLIKEDDFGQTIINPEYNADMLASAVAKHEGYFYNPDNTVFWKQSNNQGKSFLYVTTNHVNTQLIETIKADMQEDEFVLIVCKSFDSNCNSYKNIAIKKIPQSLLKNCEFGVDNYNLNIVCPPEYDEED